MARALRLPSTEEDALGPFYCGATTKGMERGVGFPWISNRFDVPKQESPTGSAPNRSEWINLAGRYRQMRIAHDSKQFAAFRTGKETHKRCMVPMVLSGMPGCVVQTNAPFVRADQRFGGGLGRSMRRSVYE